MLFITVLKSERINSTSVFYLNTKVKKIGTLLEGSPY